MGSERKCHKQNVEYLLFHKGIFFQERIHSIKLSLIQIIQHVKAPTKVHVECPITSINLYKYMIRSYMFFLQLDDIYIHHQYIYILQNSMSTLLSCTEEQADLSVLQ